MNSNPKRLLSRLDELLNARIQITLYGRAALELGFPDPDPAFGRTMDVDMVLWLGQAEELSEKSNFWESLEALNKEFDDDGLYISHLFEEDQVILTPAWRDKLISIPMELQRISLYRLSDVDLLLSKLMRYDPIDLKDADFIIKSGQLQPDQIRSAINSARIPEAAEVREQFKLCREWLSREYGI